MPVIIPVILSGGAGTRLWPLSRQRKPKQFHAFGSEGTLFGETAKRFSGSVGDVQFAPPIVVCNESQVDAARESLAQAGVTPMAFLLEPKGRNTAPAAIAAAVFAAETNPSALLLVTPSDHLVGSPETLIAAIEDAAPAAVAGKVVTFGIQPTGPETGYGYIRQGAKEPGGKAVFAIDKFAEKPKLPEAQRMLDEGGWLWNAGMFLFGAGAMVDEAAMLADCILDNARIAVEKGKRNHDVIRLDGEGFGACPSEPFDIAIMEKTKNGAVVPVSPDWSDVGSWSALWDIAAKTPDGNAGDAIFIDASNCLVRSDGPEVAVLGVKDLIVVVSEGAVMILPREQSQRVRDVVEHLKSKDRTDLL
ncbi:MAG: sugar phosphate nucleotidyltransferase [Caulobacterales bacterium]